MDPLRASWSIYWLYDCKLNRGIIIRLFSRAMKYLIILALLRYVECRGYDWISSAVYKSIHSRACQCDFFVCVCVVSVSHCPQLCLIKRSNLKYKGKKKKMLRPHIGIMHSLRLTRSLSAGKIFALVLNHHSPWTNTHQPHRIIQMKNWRATQRINRV